MSKLGKFKLPLFALSAFICTSVQLISQINNCHFLCNTDFEQDKLVQSGQFGFFDQDLVSCWNTTATDRMIEIWGSGFGGVPAYSGNQFAELNANMVSTLYQDFNASLGGSVEISFAHRGRAGLDRLSVEIGPKSGPFINLGTFSADNTKWVYNTVNYSFPASGNTNYTIRFNSVSAAGGATVGNFLDAISIKLVPPEALFTNKNPSCPNARDGAIFLEFSKGSKPFRFFWGPPLNSMDSNQINLSPGTYSVEVTDFYGCSKNYDFALQAENHPDTVLISQDACKNYLWPATGLNYDSSGSYSALFKNKTGCDSLVILNLSILPADFTLESVSSCQSYFWPTNGKIYTQSGIYRDTLQNRRACDSICILDLQIRPSYNHTDSIKVCSNYTWPINGKTYTQSGSYSESLFTREGCDSIYHLYLILHPSFSITDSIQSCESYTWPVNGNTYTQSGMYSESYVTQNGCDSTFHLKLHILPSEIHSDTVLSCRPYVWPANGQNYNQSGDYRAAFSNQNGCDSVLNLHFVKLPSSFQVDSVQSCESYTWPVNGKEYKQSGMYSESFINNYGCDSIHQLKLHIYSITKTQLQRNSCDFFKWPLNGAYYTKSGSYFDTLMSSNGCDSIIELRLQIFPSIQLFDSIRQCGSYYWPVSGETLLRSGEYRRQFKNQHSCDSTHFLHLIIDSNFVFYDTVRALEQFLWPVTGKLYTESGLYESSYQTRHGCDSLYVLILDIRHRGKVFVPNVFSPNGDGVNDRLVVFSSPEIKWIDRFRIYNRWGEMVFEQKGFPPNTERFGWDGRFKGIPMNPAVFLFTLEWTDTESAKHTESGDASLIK